MTKKTNKLVTKKGNDYFDVSVGVYGPFQAPCALVRWTYGGRLTVQRSGAGRETDHDPRIPGLRVTAEISQVMFGPYDRVR